MDLETISETLDGIRQRVAKMDGTTDPQSLQEEVLRLAECVQAFIRPPTEGWTPTALVIKAGDGGHAHTPGSRAGDGGSITIRPTDAAVRDGDF